MMEQNANPKPRRRVRLIAAAGVLIVLGIALAAWYLASARFNALVRARLVAELSQATGGRAFIGSISWSLSRLEFDIHDLTVHGSEPAGEMPLLHVDRLQLKAKILSVLGGEVGLRSIEASRPTVHIMTFADGSTNLPHPARRPRTTPVAELFRLAIDRAVIADGLVVWNQHPVPFDLRANDLQAEMAYAAADRRYDGKLRLGRLEAHYRDLRPRFGEADAEFSIYPSRAELKSLRLVTGKSHVDASGMLERFDDPRLTLAYKGEVDLAEAGLAVREPRLRGGVMALAGTASWSGASFGSEGKLAVRNGEVASGRMRVGSIDGGAVFALTPTHLEFRTIFARVLGGAVTGNASVDNWASSTRARPRTPGPPQRGAARLDLHGLPLIMLARSFSLPLERVQPDGAISGSVDAQWTGTPANAAVKLDVRAVPTPHPAPGATAVTARLNGVYHAAQQSLEIAQFALSTAATRVTASGTAGTAAADLKVAASTSNLGEIRPLLAAAGVPEKLPIENAAGLSFQGTLSGPPSGPTIAGHARLDAFRAVFQVPTVALPGPQRPARRAAGQPLPAAPPLPRREARMYWDRADADLSLSPSQLSLRNLVAQRGATRVEGGVQAALSRYRFSDYSPFTGQLSATHADLGEWARWAGIGVAVEGAADISLAGSGTVAEPRATGRIRVTGGRIDGQPIEAASASLIVQNHQAEFRDLHLATRAGRVDGVAAFHLETHAVRFDLRSDAVELAKVPALQRARISVSGLANFRAQGSGTLTAPVVNATLRVENVVVNGEQVGNLAFDVVTLGTDMRITGSTRVQTAALRLNGSVDLRGDFPAQLHLTFSQFDIDPVLRAYLQGRVTGHSSIAGDIRVSGPLRRPGDMTATGELTEMSAEIENLKLRSDGPARFSIARQELKLERLHIVGDQTDLVASGTMALSGSRRIDAAAEGRVNLQVVQSINPAYQSAGLLSITMRAGGTLDNPLLDGRVQVQNGAIAYIDLPNGLSEINGTLAFNRDRLTVERLTARTGGGGIELGGYVGFGRSLQLNLTATGRDIRLRYPPGVSSTANLDLHLTGTPRAAQLGGEITVTKFGVSPQFDFSLYLAAAKQQPGSLAPPASPLNSLRLDVHIVSTPELQVQTSLAKVSGDVDLRVRGTAARPVVLGRVNISRGDVYFNGTKYHLERGDISFSNPTRIEPSLNVEATARVRNYDVTLGLHGPMDHLATSYRSDPPLATADIIALLAFGRTREETAATQQATQNMTETASNAILGQALNAVVSNRVQKLFGVSRIKIDPQVGTATSNPTARVTIEQQVSNNITLTYITDVTQSQQQVIQLEYNVNRNVSIVAVRDQYGVVAFDVRIRQRKR